MLPDNSLRDQATIARHDPSEAEVGRAAERVYGPVRTRDRVLPMLPTTDTGRLALDALLGREDEDSERWDQCE